MTRTPARIEAPNPGSPAGARQIYVATIRHLASKKNVYGAGRIAELLGCDYTTYWRTLTRRTQMLTETEHQWADRLGCEIDDLYAIPDPSWLAS